MKSSGTAAEVAQELGATSHKQLKNKPLVEAILEIRWELDVHYKILLGRLFDRLTPHYPHHEQLPTVAIPDELCGHVVQHRFRGAEGAWPLVQVGPGILTFNSTQDYTWESFEPSAVKAVHFLFDSHPKPSSLKIAHLLLRYIDAVDFDYLSSDVFEFLRDKMKVQLALPEGLFSEHAIERRPQSFAWEVSFKSGAPSGRVTLRFATGQRNSTPTLVWETTFESAADDAPTMPDGFTSWFTSSHNIVNDCFFKLIEGELEGIFTNG